MFQCGGGDALIFDRMVLAAESDAANAGLIYTMGDSERRCNQRYKIWKSQNKRVPGRYASVQELFEFILERAQKPKDNAEPSNLRVVGFLILGGKFWSWV